jgi:HK97 family phage major capsid protein
MIAMLPPPLPESVKALRIEFGESEADKLAPTGGYKSLGHFLWDVTRCGRSKDHDALQRLARSNGAAVKAASGLGIMLDDLADWFVPVEFSSSIYSRMIDEYELLARVRRQTIRGNAIRLYAEDDGDRDEETSRLSGIAVRWLDEGEAFPDPEPQAGRYLDFNLKKLGARVDITNELVEDSQGAWEDQLSSRATRAIGWEVGRAIFEGKGGGIPLGAFSGSNPALLTIDPEAGQAAETIARANLRRMISRIPAGHLSRSTWHCSTEAIEALWDLDEATPSGSPILTPATNPNAYVNLMFRPLIPLDFCEAIGTANDLTLADWDAYQVVFKGQTRQDISMHARYSSDEAAIRFTFRMDGKPLWDKPMVPYKGTRASSPFVRLGARA